MLVLFTKCVLSICNSVHIHLVPRSATQKRRGGTRRPYAPVHTALSSPSHTAIQQHDTNGHALRQQRQTTHPANRNIGTQQNIKRIHHYSRAGLVPAARMGEASRPASRSTVNSRAAVAARAPSTPYVFPDRNRTTAAAYSDMLMTAYAKAYRHARAPAVANTCALLQRAAAGLSSPRAADRRGAAAAASAAVAMSDAGAAGCSLATAAGAGAPGPPSAGDPERPPAVGTNPPAAQNRTYATTARTAHAWGYAYVQCARMGICECPMHLLVTSHARRANRERAFRPAVTKRLVRRHRGTHTTP